MSKQDYQYDTGDTIATRHREDVGDDIDTSIEFMSEDALLFAINQFKRDIINAPYTGMVLDPQQRIRVMPTGKGFDFKAEDTFFSFVTRSALTGAFSADGDTVTIGDVTGWDDPAGAFVTYDRYGTWDFLTYSGITPATKTLSGLGNVGGAHAIGEEVNRLYKLPPDFARAKFLMVGEMEYEEGNQNPIEQFFCCYNGFLWIPRNMGTTTGTLMYYAQPTDLAEITDTLDIPKELNMALIHLLNARAFRLGGADQQTVTQELMEAANILQTAIGYSNASSNSMIKLKRKPPHSPVYPIGGIVPSRFDSANYT